MIKNSQYLWIVVAFLLISNFVFVIAQEDGAGEDPSVSGIEIEKFVGFVNGILAVILFAVTFAAFRREKKSRLAFVCLAFALFAIRSFLVGYELFFQEIHGLDPLTTILDFFVMLSFFFGILKR